MATFRDADPNKPGVQIARDARGVLQGAISEKASKVPSFTGEAAGYMRSVRSRNLPANGVPEERTTTTALVIDDAGDNDWRVSLSVPPVIQELNSDLLKPLGTDGTGNRMIFPFTPSIIFSHSASYNSMQPVHTNYPFFNYQTSSVDAITISGDFFIENNTDAKYWVAAVTFLRTLTKMFYGDNGANTGNPPPITKLNGYGEYVFKNVPCVVTGFNIDMPQDVDYLKTDIEGETDTPGNQTKPGTWVPAQSLIAVTVQPIYSRTHIEKFTLQDFVSGKLISNNGMI
jgi:hypothetical protein